jgi:hypothetical protein
MFSIPLSNLPHGHEAHMHFKVLYKAYCLLNALCYSNHFYPRVRKERGRGGKKVDRMREREREENN